MPGQETTEFTIVGAGLAGSLMACLLGQAGYRVTVHERRPDPRAKGFVGGRSINLALSARGIHALGQVGLDEPVLADAVRMPGRMVHSPQGQLTFQPYSKDPADAINSVSRGRLNITMIEAADRYPNVTLHFDHRCVDVDPDVPSAVFRDGRTGQTVTVESDALIGADGTFSAVRAQIQRLDRFDYAQSFLEHGFKELNIPPTAGGDFAMEPHALHIWPRGGYMMIALPNQDRSFTCTLFWPFQGPHSFAAVAAEDDVLPFFREHFRDAVPLMPTLVEDYLANPTSSLLTVRCSPWHWAGKVVLIGDAAHAIVPFYGQGINAGFEDCVALAKSLKTHGSDRVTAFETYFRGRKVNTEAIADLALSNFLEMRDHVASSSFVFKKKLEKLLHRWLGRWYTPLYNMVSFSLVPYAEARRKAARQTRAVTLAATALALVVIGLIWALLASF